MQIEKSILQDSQSIQYPIDAIEVDGKKYIRVKDYMYDINMVLGKGSFGIVYEGYEILDAKETSQMNKVAIKKINIPVDLEKKEEIQRLLKNTTTELFALLSLQNNNHILKLYDFVKLENQAAVYEVLEYCNQKDLNSFLKSQRKKHPICELQIRYYFMQILKGFKGLHQKKFLHRDVKPQNILVSQGVLKIADFGFAKQFQEFGQQRNTFAGTTQTAAPQIVLHMPYTDKCDIYSLGVILFWMIYQRYPIKEITTKEDYLKQIVFPSQPQISAQIKELITRMLRFEEEQRMGWDDLFLHPLFDQQDIFNRYVMKPEVPSEEVISKRKSSIRYTMKRKKIQQIVPNRTTLWLAQEVQKQYQKDQNIEKYEQRVKNQLKFEMGKVEVLKMISRTLNKYTAEDKNIISLNAFEIGLLKQVLAYATQELITFSIRRVKKELHFQTPVQHFCFQDLQYLKNSSQYKTILEEIQNRLKVQEAKHMQYKNQKSEGLISECEKYGLDQHINWLLRPFSLHPQKFQKELKRVIIELIRLLKPEVVCMQIKASRESVILCHQLFILYMRDDIFKESNKDRVNFTYFFQKEKYNRSEEGFQYIFMKIRGLVEAFVVK